MKTKTMNKGDQVYRIIDDTAGSNMLLQGISGLAGFPWTLIADGGVIVTHYLPMANKLRDLYGRSTLDTDEISEILQGCGTEILADMILDKVMGNIPLFGAVFNLLCAKAMTWRLGLLIAMLSARGDTIDKDSVKESMKLIRMMFPQQSSIKFEKPTAGTVDFLLTQVSDVPEEDYNDIVMQLIHNLASC